MNEGENLPMRRCLPWLLAGMLVAISLVLAFLGARPADEALPDSVEATFAADPPAVAERSTAEPISPDLADSDQAPPGPGARLLSDSEGARRNMLGMSIRDAGYDCPEVRSAEPIEPAGEAWRAYCGAFRLYWIEVDELGRLSVEPGAYNESEFGIDSAGGERTITIQQEDLQEQLPER